MEYSVKINEFEGPLDLLLHLIKESNIKIEDIKIDEITKQYLDYINKMEEMNLDIASEYLVMAAELIEMKSNNLLPKKKEKELVEEEDPKEELIRRLLEYESYKKMTEVFREYEEERKEIHTKMPTNLDEFKSDEIDVNVGVDDILKAFSVFMEKKEFLKPLSTKITTKEYSTLEREVAIKSLLKKNKKVEFTTLFDIHTKDYIVVTFLAVLDLVRKQEVLIEQENNFKEIYILGR